MQPHAPSPAGPSAPLEEEPPRAGLRALVIDDEPDHVELLRRALAALPGGPCELLAEADPRIALALLERTSVDVVFLDYQLPATTGDQVLEALRAAGFERPVIALTAHGDEYLSKQHLSSDRLADALERALDSFRRRAAEARVRRRAQRLEHLVPVLVEQARRLADEARTDAPTGLLNRRGWEEMAQHEEERSRRVGRPYGVLLVDIDSFKRFNDAAGHLSGDRCLHAVAVSITRACRSMDVVGRWGGEEFVVLVPDTNWEGTSSLAERARRALEAVRIPHPGLGRDAHVTVSVGASCGTGVPWRDLVEQADRALYVAKRLGRNQTRVYVRRPAAAPPRS